MRVPLYISIFLCLVPRLLPAGPAVHAVESKVGQERTRPPEEECPPQRSSLRIGPTLDGKEYKLSLPHGIAYDEKTKTLLITSFTNDNEVVRVEPRSGKILARFPVHERGEVPSQEDRQKESGTRGGPALPRNLSVTATGDIAVAMSYHEKIRVFSAEGKKKMDVGSTDISQAVPDLALYKDYTAVCSGNEILIFKGNALQRRIDTVTTGKGPETFSNPNGIAADADGNLFVVDLTNWRIVRITNAFSDGKAPLRMETVVDLSDDPQYDRFKGPYGVTFDRFGDMYVSFYGTGEIRRYSLRGTRYVPRGVLTQNLHRNVRHIIAVGCEIYAVDGQQEGYVRFAP